MDDLINQAQDLLLEIKQAVNKLGLENIEQERDGIREQMQKPGFWKNPKKAQELSKKEAVLTKRLEPWKKVSGDADLVVYLLKNGEKSAAKDLKDTKNRFEKLKKELRFNGPYDDHDVILSIYAGAGGTDAQDWAQMLMRMYIRWAESQNIKVKIIDESPGEEAGIKSATIELSGGAHLYGRLAGEHGVHRLVRLSPFNADHLRQTSFAKVEILPLIDKPEDVQLDDKDLKIDVFRSGGRGGQSVNTTDSAVRVTHIPTGLSVSIQNERSQLKNKHTAHNILRSKIVQLQLEQHAKDLGQLKGPNQSAEWGSQIRSYVLHPYKQVKDNRSGYESTGVEKVLEGKLNPVIDAWLEHLT